MRLLRQDEIGDARGALDRVFRTLHLPAGPFRAEVADRSLLVADYHLLFPPQFEALRLAAAPSMTAYLAEYYFDWDGDPQPEVWREVDLTRPKDYFTPSGWGRHEHAIVAKDGAWGMLSSDGEDAVAGGDQRFMARLRANLPETDDETIRKYVADSILLAAGGAPRFYVGALLAHVYGLERARRAVAGTPFESQLPPA